MADHPKTNGDRWIVAASGPSLTSEVAHRVRMARWIDGWNVLCVNDAYRLLPHADVLYACDWSWWREHNGAPKFDGERWTSTSKSANYVDDKSAVIHEFNVKTIEARDGRGFSDSDSYIHYGYPQPSSGFQAVNLALMFGASLVVLVGFDGHSRNGAHFFGDHPEGLRRTDDAGYRDLAKSFMPDSRVVNATPGSSIEVFERADLEEVLRDRRVYRNGSIPHIESNRDSSA